MRLLIIEDDLALQTILAKRLINEGYGVDRCGNGTEGLHFAQSADYDGIILDIMLPDIDGMSILRKLRSTGSVAGILLLTAKDSIDDRVAGLDAGADDYLVKPFAFEELLARLRTLLRHTTAATPSRMHIDDLLVDVATHDVTRAGKKIVLTSKEYTLLEYLLYNAGCILTRKQILDHVWSNNYGVESNIVDVYIRYVRKKIDDGFEKKLLHTARGYGYVLKGCKEC